MSSPTQKDLGGIESFPAELLCIVFLFTHNSSIARTPTTLPSVHTLTHICRFWRNVAQNLPELWTDIHLFHCRPGHPDMLDEYARRSSNLPLDILLDIPFDVSGKQLTRFWNLIMKIWTLAPRWRRLCIVSTAENLSSMQIVGRKTAPLLESLELRVSESMSWAQPKLSFGSTPVLRSLLLHGISLENFEIAPFVNRLENLDLFSTSNALVMQLAEHFDTSSGDTQSIPRLRHLSLRSTIPRLDGPAGAVLKSYICELRTLTLGNFNRHHLSPLFPLLSSTVLEELSLNDLGRECWDGFVLALNTNSLTFPALRVLKLSSIPSAALHANADFARAFPALEHLSLLHVNCSTFLAALAEPSSNLWPRLRSVVLNNADYRALCSVVEGRIAAGVPLAALEVDSPKFIDATSLQWLQKHVALTRNLA
ncbi:hypothetical protein DFH06DRAFT_757778 [Mycena polygramma]|nr:hypothetical protein DFH06DRAFT_757778 [Mycena polygramma]